MAKPSVKPPAKAPANRRRSTKPTPTEKEPLEVKEDLETPAIVESEKEVTLDNVELIEKLTLQACRDYARTVAIVIANSAAGTLAPLQHVQHLSIVGNECSNLFSLLKNIKEAERNCFINCKPIVKKDAETITVPHSQIKVSSDGIGITANTIKFTGPTATE